MSDNIHYQGSHESATVEIASKSPSLPGVPRKRGAWPGVLDRLAVTVGDSGTVEVSTQELGQVIQRILTVGVVLTNTLASAPKAANSIGNAIGELDDAAGMIRSMACRARESAARLDMLAARLA